MKKTFAFLLLISLILSLAGCSIELPFSTRDKGSAAPTEVSSAPIEETPAPIENPTAPSSDVFTVACGTEIFSCDPIAAATAGERTLVGLVYEPLVAETDESGNVIRGLISYCSPSNGGKDWEFHIRDGALWSDGTPIYANDVLAAFRRLCSQPELSEKIRGVMSLIKGYPSADDLRVSVTDDSTFTINLNNADPGFPTYIREIAISPVRAADGYTASDLENISFTGPYVISEWDAEHILCKPNSCYADAPENDILFLLSDADKALEQYNNGTADVLLDIPDDMSPSDENYTDAGGSVLNTVYLRLNTEKPPLSDENVRHAISNCIDRQALSYNGLIDAPCTVFDASPPIADIPASTVTITVCDSAADKGIAEYIGKALKNIGLTVVEDTVSPYSFSCQIDIGAYEIALCTVGGNPFTADAADCSIIVLGTNNAHSLYRNDTEALVVSDGRGKVFISFSSSPDLPEAEESSVIESEETGEAEYA